MFLERKLISLFPNNSRAAVAPQNARGLRAFVANQQGTLAVFSLFIFLSMLFMAGLAIDLMRHENERIRMQNTADRAVIAATLVNENAASAPTPESILQAYFAAEGLTDQLGSNYNIEALGTTGRRVTVYPGAQVNTLLSSIIGIDSFDMVTPAQAEQIVGADGGKLELVMVLDISGSMNGQGKIGAMQTAANDLITTVLDAPGTDEAAVTLVPYHSRVLPPPGVLNSFTNATGNGACNTWNSWTDLTNTPAQPTNRTGCVTDTWRTIRPYLDNPAEATGFVNQLVASGGTSIDLGVRWGAAFFDPAMRPIINDMIVAGDVDPVFQNRPLDWNTTDATRVLILLTDGQNNAAQSDTNTLEVCTALKNLNVTIYAVAFQAPAAGATLMQSCASSASHYYEADVNEIQSAFEGITNSIQAQMLRLTQ